MYHTCPSAAIIVIIYFILCNRENDQEEVFHYLYKIVTALLHYIFQ